MKRLPTKTPNPLHARVARYEALEIINELTTLNGNSTQTAKSLGLSLRGLQIKMSRLGIDPNDYRPEDAKYHPPGKHAPQTQTPDTPTPGTEDDQ